MQLERESGVPLYQQLKNALRLGIETGVWRQGQPIPSEPELSETLGIARGTVRSAIAKLVREGWLERRQGEGTYVTRRSLEQDLMGFYSFAREAKQHGLELTSQVLEWANESAAGGLARRLRLETGAAVLRVTRLRLLEQEPILVETCYLPEEIVRPLREEDFAKGAFYDALEERCRVRVTRAEETFEAIALSEYKAELLQVAPGAPAFRVERIAYSAGDQPVELRLGTIRGDRCRYHIELR